MSGDGPTKVAPPGVEPLDDIILGEDDQPAPVRSTPPAPPVKIGSIRPPAPPPAGDGLADNKHKKKLTLRIPDDEVSRPAVASSQPTRAARPARPASIPDDGPNRIRGGSPDGTLALPVRPASGVDTSDERGWTPYQPPVTENGGGVRQVAAKTLIDEPPITPPPSFEEIPIETDMSGEDIAVEDAATQPRLPLLFDSEEIELDESERTTDPAEAPEVDLEDLVSVESILTPGRPPPPAKGASSLATPAAPAPQPSPQAPKAPTAAALVAQAMPAPANPPAASKPAASLPSPNPLHAQPSPQAPKAPTPALQRPNTQPCAISPTPLVLVANVGALAPPAMSETAAMNKKKVRPWWEELFNDDYIRTMAKVTDAQIATEATFIEDSLGCESGAMILDLACGTGRHAVELARRGYQVVGFDLSLSMLARASDEAQERAQKINFVQGDMREMTFEDTFDGIYAWNTSFGFFDEEKNSAVVARVHRALKKGGQFLLDVVNRDYIVRQAPSLAWFEGDGCICMDEMTIDFITSRMKVKRTLMMDDGRTKEIEYSIRVYSLHELGKMLHDNGFRVAEVSGRTATPGVFFGCESPRALLLAEKR